MAVDLALSLFTAAGILLFFALLMTLLRCITRIYIVKAFGSDDWFMMASVVLYAHYCAWVFYGRSLDQGKTTVEIPPENIPLALQSFYFAETSYILVACTLKFSIGTFLLRILRSKAQIYTIYVMLFVVSVATVAIFFASVFQCKPVSHFWNKESPGTCLDPNIVLGLAYFQAAVIAASDFGFTLMPVFVLASLQMDRFTKISVCSLMGLGAIAGFTTILRIPFLKDLISTTNFFHATAELAIFASVEPGLGIIIGSAAATRPLFRLLFSKYHPFVSLSPQKSSKSSNGTTNTYTGSSNRRSRRDIEIGHPIPMEQYDVERGPGVQNVIEGGRIKRICRKCELPQERCARCGTTLNVVRPSEESTLKDGQNEGVIYKDMAVERVVEFLTKT